MEDFVCSGPETGDDAGLKESAKEDLLGLGQLSGGAALGSNETLDTLTFLQGQ